MKNSPFAKRQLRAKRIFGHALSRESQALSPQPLHLRLIWFAKLDKDELGQLQFNLNSAKLQPGSLSDNLSLAKRDLLSPS